MANVRRQLQSLLGRGKEARSVEEPWWMPEFQTGRALSGLAGAIETGYDKAKERNKNAVMTGINLLPELAGLIKTEEDLTNYENMSAKLTKNAERNIETAPYAPFISGIAGNLREDYNMYTKTMESGAEFIDDPNFITDMQGWDDLENVVAKMTLEDGKTPKYQGNGTFLFLTEQMNAINSLTARIQNSSKGTQFRYNKAGNKYTDAEMIKNLEDYQGRLGVALEASLGDGIITKEEAESIMLGDLPAYQKRKGTALKRIDSHYNKLDSYQQKLLKDLRTIELKPEGFDFSGLLRIQDVENATIIGKEDRYDDGSTIEGLNFDTSVSPTNKQDIIKQMQDQVATIHGLKSQYKKSHTAWSGDPFRPKVIVSKEEKENLLGNIMTPKITGITGTDQDQLTSDEAKAKAASYDLDVKDNTWGYDDPSSFREDYKARRLSDTPSSPLYAIDGVYQYPELFEKKKKKVTSKIDDQKPSKTDIDEKRFSNQPDLFPTLKRSNGKFVFMDGKNLKEWDNTAHIKGFDDKIPVLNAGYDKYYWYNGKWRHISSAKRKSPIAPKRVSEESKYTREVILEEASKDIKKMAKKLGYSDVGDATKKTEGKPAAENVYKYSKSIWESLPKETKAQFGSFNAFMEAVISASKSGIEFNTE